MYHKNERLKFEDSIIVGVQKLSEGNPGAATVCMKLLEKNAEIDPDSMLGDTSGLLALDTHGIYGSRIWMLFKDVCGQNIVAMIAVLRAVQLGYESDKNLDFAIDNRGKGINIAELHAKVKDRLPRFADITGNKEAERT